MLAAHLEDDREPNRLPSCCACCTTTPRRLAARRGGKLLLCQPCEVLQEADLLLVKPTRSRVDDTQGSHAAFVGENERVASIEPDPRFTGDQWIVCKSGIKQRVRNDHGRLAQDSMSTKGDLTRCLASVKAIARLEPLPILIDEADDNNGNVEKLGGEPRNAIEPIFGRGVEDAKVMKGCKSLLLVMWKRRPDPTACRSQQ